MRIGLAQMNSQDDKEANLKSAETLIDQLVSKGADFIVLPEYFLFIGDDPGIRANAEPIDGPAVNRIRLKAVDHKVHIHTGSFPELDAGEIYNTSIVFDPKGEIIAKYRKIHMFDVEIPGGVVIRESDTMTPGSDIVTVQLGDFLVGLTICYDLRFPELYRRLAQSGSHLILIPSAFTLQTGRDHWEILLRARAVENLCWVAAAAQWGVATPGQETYGRSMIINPWGLVIAQAHDGVTSIVADIDLTTLNRMRTRFPALNHIREDLFDL